MSSPTAQETTEPDDINVGLVATIAIVGALLVIAIAASLTALVRSESTRYGQEVGAYANLGAVRRLKAEQSTTLEAPPSWVDRSKGLVSIPIDRAMELVTTEIQKNPYSASVAPPAPPAAVESAPPAEKNAGAAGHNEKDETHVAAKPGNRSGKK